MTSFLRPLRLKSLAFLIVVFLLTLTACAGNNGVSNRSRENVVANSILIANNSSIDNSASKKNVSSSSSTITITVGGKQDIASQLLTKLYVLLLRHARFNVIEHASYKTDDAVFTAIISGHIGLAPSFTAGGLGKLGLNSTGNALRDYLQIRQGYGAKYHVTWLEPAPLNAKVYNSVPVVRDSVLKKTPLIAITLNKLAPILTVQVSQQLQSEVVKNRKSVTVVATQFLRSKKLL
jgi:glycine betaine/choline ABC-type transport system substrate-binding protein